MQIHGRRQYIVKQTAIKHKIHTQQDGYRLRRDIFVLELENAGGYNLATTARLEGQV